MKTNKIYSLLIVSLALIQGGCGGGGSSAEVGNNPILSGTAQKGPLLKGAVVTINELTLPSLYENGKSYTFETINDDGKFNISATLGSPYLETTAQGYYFNEITNSKSQEWVVLRGLSNISTGSDKAINVSVLTSFVDSRVKNLVTTKGMTVAAARFQAEKELLAAFYIYNYKDIFPGGASNGVNVASSFIELDLAKSRQQDQILAAISSLVANIEKTTGGVNQFITGVEQDLADDGILNNSTGDQKPIQSAINAVSANTPFDLAAKNINTVYALKPGYATTDLSQWVDSSGGIDRVIDKFKYSIANAKPGVEVKAPAYVAGSDDVGQCFYATVGKIYKNGTAQTSVFQAASGDRIEVGITPSAGGSSVSYIARNPVATTGKCPALPTDASIRLLKYSVTGASAVVALPASFVGANMPGVVDWNPTPIFADMIFGGRQFGAPTHPWGGLGDAVPVGADGWPVGDFGIYLSSATGDNGIYKVYFNGQATVSLNGSPNTVLANQKYDATNNLTTLDVVRSAGAEQMTLAFTNTGAGVKNLKVFRPGYSMTNNPIFTNEFVNHIKRFKTLRFMEWLIPNSPTIVQWADRPTPQVHYNSPLGVPWEYIVALANQAQKDIWITIPVAASDDYVLQLAKYLHGSLNPSLNVYIEYANEVWNSSFQAFYVNKNLATAEVQANPTSALVYDGTTDANMMGYRRTALRIKQISDIFKGVYGAQSINANIRPVLAGQVVQPYILQQQLNFLEANFGAPSKYIYAIAGAPYFNMGADQQVDGLSVVQVLSDLSTSVKNSASENSFEDNIALAAWYKLKFLGYEGGVDTSGSGSLAAKSAANLDPGMQSICQTYMANWYASGAEMMMWYTAGATYWNNNYGTFGLTNDFANLATPKIKCLDAVMVSNKPALNGRNVVPGTINAMAFVGSHPPYSSTSLKYLHTGSYVDYVILAPYGGTYSLSLFAETSSAGNQVDVMVNNTVATSQFELKNGGTGNPQLNTAIPLPLNQGFNTVRIRTRAETTGYFLSQLSIQ